MSALATPLDESPRTERPLLRLVPQVGGRRINIPWVPVVILVLIACIAGVLVFTTTIQTQQAELNRLQQEAAQLSYQEAALQAQVQNLRSSRNLASRAYEMGMRPNPHPAFIQMPDGTVAGDPTPVTGDELGGMVPAEVIEANAVAAARTKAEEEARLKAEAKARASASTVPTQQGPSATPSQEATAAASGQG